MTRKLEGEVQTWNLEGEPRKYIVVTVSFGEAYKLFRSQPFSALTGKGEQREVVEAHANRLKRAMLSGRWTPCPVSVGVGAKRATHFIKYTQDKSKATIDLPDGETLPLTDGGHRFMALTFIKAEAEQRARTARKAQDKKTAEALAKRVDEQPVTVMLLLDGSTQDDFVNLQQGKPVDRSHMVSIQVLRNALDPKQAQAVRVAFNIAKTLNERDDSFFHKQIRFDTRSRASTPISTLMAVKSSDLGTSLVGLARVGLALVKNRSEQDLAGWLAGNVVTVEKALRQYAGRVLEPGKVLTPPPDGTRGAATMLVGVTTALVYRRLATHEGGHLKDTTKERLIEAAKVTLDVPIKGKFAGQDKRKLIGQFVEDFFHDVKGIETNGGLPVELLEILAPSAFGVEPVPKHRLSMEEMEEFMSVPGPEEVA